MTTTTAQPAATVDDGGLPGSHLGYFNDVTTPVWDRVTREVEVPTMTLTVVTL